MEKSSIKTNNTLMNSPNENEIYYKTKGDITR